MVLLIKYYIGILIFFFPVLIAIYSQLSFFLILGLILTIVSSFSKQKYHSFEKEEIWVLLSFAIFFLHIILFSLSSDFIIRDIDKYSRFLLVLPFYFYIKRTDISPKYLIFGIVLSSIVLGILSIAHTVLSLDYLFIKHSGIVALIASVVGLSCLYGIHQDFSKKFNAILLIAGILSLLLLINTGARGVLFASFITMIFLNFFKILKGSRFFNMTIVVTIICLIIAVIFSANFNQRVKLIYSGINEYAYSFNPDISHGESVISRLELWKTALIISNRDILFGIGLNKFKSAKDELIDKGEVQNFVKRYRHPHGEFLSTIVERGLIGLVFLLGVFISPLYYCFKYTGKSRGDPEKRFLILIIAVTSLQYLGYSITNGVFDHQTTTLFYAFLVVTCLGFAGKTIKEKT